MIRLRQFAVAYYSDGKKKIDFGEPDAPVAAASRHRRAAMVAHCEAMDHDTGTKFAVEPNVNFFPFIPQRIDEEGAFYRGITYVHLRETLFDGSTPWKHGVELFYDLHDLGKNNLDTAWVDPKFCVLGGFTDGGADQNMQHMKVQATQIALFLYLGIDALYRMRCTPNAVYTLPIICEFSRAVHGHSELAIANNDTRARERLTRTREFPEKVR